MTPEQVSALSDMPYVLKKHGMYYAHNNCGYVSRVELAEIYTKDYAIQYAENHEDIYAIPVSELITDARGLSEYVERIEAMRDAIIAMEGK